MQMISTKFEGDELVIRCRVDEAAIEGALPSKSGKTRMVASTSGFVGIAAPCGQQVKLSLNLTTQA